MERKENKEIVELKDPEDQEVKMVIEESRDPKDLVLDVLMYIQIHIKMLPHIEISMVLTQRVSNYCYLTSELISVFIFHSYSLLVSS